MNYLKRNEVMVDSGILENKKTMLSNYVKDKFIEKVKIHLEMFGKSSDINIDHLVKQVVDYGKYEIIWDSDFTKPIGIKRLGDNYKMEVTGRYVVSTDKDGYNRILYSSQFIDFNITEYRDERLDKLLKNKI